MELLPEMGNLWAIALPILIVDVANPVLFAAVILCMSTERSYVNALVLIAGHTVSYTLFGVLIIYGLAKILGDWLAPILELIQNPEPGDYLIAFLLGLLLLWIAVRWRSNPPDSTQRTPDTRAGSVFSYFVFGAVINFVGAPFAVPYFAFINQLMRLDQSVILPNLLLYNVLYALSFLLVPLAVAVFGRSILPLLQRFNAFVEKSSAYIIPLLLGILGLFLVTDAMLFFTTGTGLI